MAVRAAPSSKRSPVKRKAPTITSSKPSPFTSLAVATWAQKMALA